jgi:hypothetical protein
VGVSYDGNDIPGWKAHDVGGIDACCKQCATHPQCKYWSMDRPSSDCFLKSAKPPGPCNHWPMTVSGTPGAGCRPHYNPAPPPPPPPPPPAAVVDYEIAVDAALVFSISTIAADGTRTLLDRFDRSIPVPTGAAAAGGGNGGCDFKLLLRGSMVELYINSVLTVPFALPNTVSAGGYSGWAAGVRAPTVTVALSGGWAAATLEGWTMGLPALFPQN